MNKSDFIEEYEQLCRKYKLCLSHEDKHGGFLVVNINQDDIEWVRAAFDATEDNGQKKSAYS